MIRKKINSKGFSLVELISAVAILGVSVTVLLNAFAISTNVSKKVQKQSEATLAGKNILEAVGAKSADDFYNEDANGDIRRLLGNDISVSLLEDKDDDGNFTVALEGLKAGSSEYDATVEFSRGHEDDANSDGLYLINSNQIRLAQYDAMDGVFCQPYEVGSNPDLLVEDEMRARALAKGIDPDSVVNKERVISLYVYHDPEYDWTLKEGVPGPDDDGFDDLEHTGRYHYATVRYEYRFSYPGGKNITWEQAYTVFPGGYEPKNKDGSVSIYLMYFPVYTDQYIRDEIRIYNNCLEPDGTPLEYWLDDAENPYTVALNTYIYCQDPYEYNSALGQYEYTTHTADVSEQFYLHLPESFELNDLKGTYIYTNAKEISGDSFRYGIVKGYMVGWTDPQEKELDNDLVRKVDKIKIYNIKVSLYPAGTIVEPPATDTDGIPILPDDAEPTFIIDGSKTN
ncbi:MAG: type II secretion system protein [Clostridia bacterium]|nr:type II secretion system protein [Clostridia bacterium]